MNENIDPKINALRKQHDAPDLATAGRMELIDYLLRLERVVVDLARVRDNLYARLDETGSI